MGDEEEGSTVVHVKERVPRDRPLGVIHSGSRYFYGFGPSSYAIWDIATEGPPVEEFPPTKQGKIDGWNQYVEMEPAAQKIPPEQSPIREEIEWAAPPPNRRALLVWGGIVAALAIGIVVFVLTRPEDTGTGAGTATGPKVTHLETTGAFTVNEDLTQQSFTPPTEGLISANLKGTWAGATSELAIEFSNPRLGQFPTTDLANRFFTITITDAEGTKIPMASRKGECNINIITVNDTTFSATFECPTLRIPDSDVTVSAKGTLFGQA